VDLAESRRRASALSGGISSEPIKSLILRLLERERAGGSLLDFGAGTGELLTRLHGLERFEHLAGIDLFPRPATLPAEIDWHQQDLNDVVESASRFDTVVCSETIEHLENPRHVFRVLRRLLRPGGLLVLTMPNQESIRSYAGLLFAGHFTHFLGACYPAHITALLRLDLARLCAEHGFAPPAFAFTDDGAIPKLATVHWQQVSFGMLRGRLFSDNLAMTTRVNP
jgi:2-polyprenyl-3-methyl-5-hydroxy-6-metoxy-1,4-benzoquinol methylase